jgi:hypothetical protein
MDELRLKFIGETSLMQHDSKLANPLDPYTQEMSRRSGKRKKTIEDIWDLARIEWEGSMYLHEGKIQIPSRVINRTLLDGAKKQTNGTLWKTGCMITTDFHPLEYKGKTINIKETDEIPNPQLDEFFKPINYLQALVRVKTSKILRTRPVFHDWSCETTILHDPSIMQSNLILQAAVDAGRLCGFCEWRPSTGGNYGRFKVEVV